MASTGLRWTHMTYATLIRTANERGYLQTTWAEWKEFRDARNITAHAYGEPAAEKIVALIPGFLAAAADLLEGMNRKRKQA